MAEIKWTCQVCNFNGILSTIEKLMHKNSCNKENPADSSKTFVNSRETKKKNAVAYNCPQCNKTLYLAPTEVLKLKKQHES